MRASLDWIREFVNPPASPEEIADRLTMAGLEIEGMERIDGDVLMEVNVTPNRPDCLSILGIAREVAAAYGLPLTLPEIQIDGALPPSPVTVVIDDPELCPRYTGRSISNVTVAGSPVWMKERLEKCGIRSINNIVDITNYVLLEFGHPLHAFDADKLAGSTVRIARAGEDRSMPTLDGIERTIPPETLLIWDGELPVAIAGIMGGEGSSVTDSTRNVFLESACFEPSSIRKSSKLLGLRSESSYRFERGTDRIFLESALNRAARLIAEIGGGKISDIVDMYPIRYSPREIRVSYDRTDRLIGISLDKTEIFALLNGVGIHTVDMGDFFSARPPAFRGDISQPVDIIEEIVRCYGYDRVPPRRPRTTLSDGVLNIKERTVHAVRESIRKSGFNEVVNFSFMNSGDLDLLAIEDHEHESRRKHIMLKNPLRQEECLMRTTLLPALIRNFLYNRSRGIRDIRLFEISRVFVNYGRQLPSEGLKLAGIYFQDSTPVIWKDQTPAFYCVKGALEALFEEVGFRGYSLNPSGEVFLHAGKSADISYGESRIGYMGELSPQIVEKLDLKLHKPQIMVFEIDLDLIFTHRDCRIVFRHIPRYPSIERDIALIIDEHVTAAGLLTSFGEYQSDIIEQVELFDYYKGKNILPDKKSLGLRVIYRSKDRTLTEAEIEPVHLALLDFISAKTGAKLRGPA